jgi:hypothetical protein
LKIIVDRGVWVRDAWLHILLEEVAEMRVYILCSVAGHYKGVFKSRKEAEEHAINEEMLGYEIFMDVLNK